VHLLLLPFRNRINAAIVQLTDSGELTRLENKWWVDECGYEAKVRNKERYFKLFLQIYLFNKLFIFSINFYLELEHYCTYMLWDQY